MFIPFGIGSIISSCPRYDIQDSYIFAEVACFESIDRFLYWHIETIARIEHRSVIVADAIEPYCHISFAALQALKTSTFSIGILHLEH